ncbi:MULTISPECIES: acyl carrier protein [Streptomyces]|uniref:Acyl carrier protein n=1 Tax=Streptomyces doebereineriae TaxID=3075528 RepID=A0ABU2VCW8_9ACTN|nr:acyl carrier protein [Streptomyces sp. DSM 41640]MDT0482757.1 acyl carrier protein [Streptomyces sp. DSM 41640]
MRASDNQDEIEDWVVEICKGLGLPVTDADSDFFEAGGTSLTAMRLIGKAEETYGEDALPPDDLYAESSLRDIAAAIRRNGSLASAGGER